MSYHIKTQQNKDLDIFKRKLLYGLSTGILSLQLYFAYFLIENYGRKHYGREI
jgi:hypothetical protein